jgi:bacterioferritin
MKGNPDVIEKLNAALTHSLTAINQYFVHAKMCKNWGFHTLAGRKRKLSIAQMWYADWLIDRILLLEGVPNMQRMNPVKVGEDVPEQHTLDLEAALEAQRLYNEALEFARRAGDNGSRDLLERILEEEEEAIDWLEGETHVLGEVGTEHYLAQQLGEREGD